MSYIRFLLLIFTSLIEMLGKKIICIFHSHGSMLSMLIWSLRLKIWISQLANLGCNFSVWWIFLQRHSYSIFTLKESCTTLGFHINWGWLKYSNGTVTRIFENVWWSENVETGWRPLVGLRAHQSLANYEKRVVQPKAEEEFAEAGRFCMSYKRPHRAPLPACSNLPLRIPQIGPSLHPSLIILPQKFRRLIQNCPRSVMCGSAAWRGFCRDKARVRGCQSGWLYRNCTKTLMAGRH